MMDGLKQKYNILTEIGIDYKLLMNIQNEITNDKNFVLSDSNCFLYYYKRLKEMYQNEHRIDILIYISSSDDKPYIQIKYLFDEDLKPSKIFVIRRFNNL